MTIYVVFQPTANSYSRVSYREAIGSTMFAAIATRPDIHFAVCLASIFLNCFDNTHWAAIKQIPKFLNATQAMGILYNHDNNTMTGY